MYIYTHSAVSFFFFFVPSLGEFCDWGPQNETHDDAACKIVLYENVNKFVNAEPALSRSNPKSLFFYNSLYTEIAVFFLCGS